MSQKYLQVSVNFRSEDALTWLAAISESNAIVSAILAVIHPKLYNAGWKCYDLSALAPFIFPNYPLAFPLYFSVLFHLLTYQTPRTTTFASQPPLKPYSLSHLSLFTFMTRSLNPVACILGCTYVWTVRLIAQ